MTAVQLLNRETGLRDPVMEITGRIERARSKLRLERGGALSERGESAYSLYDGERLVGAICTPKGRPAFGAGAAAVLLRREP